LLPAVDPAQHPTPERPCLRPGRTRPAGPSAALERRFGPTVAEVSLAGRTCSQLPGTLRIRAERRRAPGHLAQGGGRGGECPAVRSYPPESTPSTKLFRLQA